MPTEKSETVRLLTACDIYDLYGCSTLLGGLRVEGKPVSLLNAGELNIVTERLQEIQSLYVNASKSRIKAEAVFVGHHDLANTTLSFAQILANVRKIVAKELESSLEKRSNAMLMGGGVNLMQTLLNAHKKAGSSLAGFDAARFGVTEEPEEPKVDRSIDPNWFKKGADSRIWDNPKWHAIAEAYLKMEEAVTNEEIIESIDRLNQLQHNSFHILIDLQTGRMLSDYSNAVDHEVARKQLQEILDIKYNAKGAYEYASKMSKTIRQLLKEHYGTIKG